MVLALVLTGSFLVGCLAGFATFKRSLAWCRNCGTTLTCDACTRRPQVTSR